jgi:alkaline phosphatase D
MNAPPPTADRRLPESPHIVNNAAMAPRRIHRRDFLRLAALAVAASATPLAGCGDSAAQASSSPEDQDRVFPQGIASGDPAPDSVVLWTRIEGAGASETVRYEVALDEGFRDVVAQGDFTTDADRDHTVKLKPVGLAPFTTYYYRFVALGVVSITGRTKTAPAPDQDVPVRFAFASCQDFKDRYYHAWRALVEGEAPVDFVVFLGDYVYETGAPAAFPPDGDRGIVLPDGLPLGSTPDSGRVALTVADYRSLYRQYRSDAYLRRAHQLYPFVSIWDDHEFGNDAWSDHTTHFSDLRGDEKMPEQREAADQAWWEYMAVDVPYDGDASYPDDIRIYRSLRYGRHAELFLVDSRYYRDDHVIPEGPVDLSVGKFAPNSSLGSRNFALKSGFDAREAAARPTLLGAAQKAWLVDGVSGSDATWKFLGNGLQMAQMALDLSGFPQLPDQFRDEFYFSMDQWDGYRSERAEILGALSGVRNLVSIAGDIHAFYASELHVDFDAPGEPVAPEFVVAGISSSPVQEETRIAVEGNPTLVALGLADLVPMFDEVLQEANPHYRYTASLANGIAVAEVAADAIEVEFLHVSGIEQPQWDGAVERVRFRVASGSPRVTRI